LSTTANYNTGTTTPKISGAGVRVLDDLGNVFVYLETEPGTYKSNSSFKGVVGRTYHVELLYDGEIYRSSDELLQKAPAIQNIRYYYLENQLFVEDGYYVYFDFQEDPTEKNAFRIVQIYEGKIANQPGDIIAFNDEFFNGEFVDSLSFNEPLELGDQYEVQIWSLSDNARSFITEVEDQAGGTGGPFSVPPAPIYGNLYNLNDPNELVWGYFSASDIVSDSVTILP